MKTSTRVILQFLTRNILSRVRSREHFSTIACPWDSTPPGGQPTPVRSAGCCICMRFRKLFSLARTTFAVGARLVRYVARSKPSFREARAQRVPSPEHSGGEVDSEPREHEIMGRQVMIEAAINGNAMRDLNPNIPYSPEEIANDAIATCQAGAALIHFHVRDPRTGRW